MADEKPAGGAGSAPTPEQRSQGLSAAKLAMQRAREAGAARRAEVREALAGRDSKKDPLIAEQKEREKQQAGGGWKKLVSLVHRNGTHAVTSVDVPEAPSEAPQETAAASAAQETPAPESDNPIAKMDKDLLGRCIFMLANPKGIKVVMMVSFAPETTPEQMLEIKRALESKTWGKVGEEEEGKPVYASKVIVKDGKTALAISDDMSIGMLIKDLMDAGAGGRIKTSDKFISTPEFDDALKFLDLPPLKGKYHSR